MQITVIAGIEIKDVEAFKRRFLSKTAINSDSGCWMWTGAKDRKGYGKFSVGGACNHEGKRRNSMVTASRVSYELFIGRIPESDGYHGQCILHRCDTPSCVNPEHLFHGSNMDNVKDMDKKGRRVTVAKRGSEHKNSILTEEVVEQLFDEIKERTSTQGELAKKYGVSLATVNHIKTGQLCSHITGVMRK